MATRPTIRLRVDPPYPGESMSSFLGRASQFYTIPPNVLLTQLLNGEMKCGKGAVDVDLNPSPALERRLAESVVNWRSPLADFRGFHGPVVIQRSRHAYCPRCFQEDLEAGRTPYFRMDWSAFYVSTCWRHGTFLLPWYDTTTQGLRRLPKSWIYRTQHVRDGTPAFYRDHLERLKDFMGDRAKIYGGLSARNVMAHLAALQSAVEKPSTSPMLLHPEREASPSRLRLIAYEIAVTAVIELWGVGSPEIAIEPESFEFVPVPEQPRKWRSKLWALRRTGDLSWRRTFLCVVAMSLAGTDEYGAVLTPSGKPRPWRRWWSEHLIPLVGESYRGRFEDAMDLLSWRLDGLDWSRPGVPTPSEVRKRRPNYKLGRKRKVQLKQ
jgi:hypothetical protein